MGKTGTSTMASVFGAYRSAHECDAPRMKQVAARARAGQLDPARARHEMRRRSRKFGLEVDSAHFLTPFVPDLADLYPDARFVVLIRDCFSWMDSLLEHWARVNRAAPEAVGTAGLADTGIRVTWATVSDQLRRAKPSLGLAAALTKAWSSTNTRLLADAPADRTLVIRTDDLDAAGPRLASFCEVELATLRLGARVGVAPSRQGVLAAVPPAFARREAERWCSRLMEEFWGPGWRELDARVGAWAAEG
jgi:hypothetical protein